MTCTTRRSTFGDIEREFHKLTSGQHPLTVDGREIDPSLPDQPIALDELRNMLLSGTASNEFKNAAWSALVRRCRDDHERWTIACAAMMLPGMRRIAANASNGYQLDNESISSEVLLGFLEALHDVDPAAPRIPAVLYWAAKSRALKARTAELRALGRTLAEDRSASANQIAPLPGHPDLVLAHAVSEGVVSAEDAELVGDTRLSGQTLEAAATRLGLSRAACRKRRSRAEDRLLRFLGHPHAAVTPGLAGATA